ncbi:MAG: hypothetical protein HY960_06015 [Ignavibacteriae bacterium]|nr:hypothetical protein [Ignavibacteriota bacterium]
MKYLVYFVTVFFLSQQIVGQVNKKSKRQPTEVTASYPKSIIQGFNMKLRMNSELMLGKEALGAYEGVSPSSEYECDDWLGLEYPVHSCVDHLYGGGPILGGIVNGVRYVSAAYYPSDAEGDFQQSSFDKDKRHIFTSSIDDTLYNSTRTGFYKYAMNRKGVDDDNDGKTDEDMFDGLDNDGDWNELTDDLGSDGLPDTLEIGCRGGFEPYYNPDPANDNWDSTSYDVCKAERGTTPYKKNSRYLYTQGNKLPDNGEQHVDEDYATISDNDILLFSTDTVATLSWHNPIGIKIHQRSFAWKDKWLEGILPIEYTITNFSNNIIHDVYMGMICDMDVGWVNGSSFASRNYSGYYPNERTAYIHNPLDRYATPAGVTLLGSSIPFNALRIVYNWYEFEADDCGSSPYNEDEMLECMKCGPNEHNCIKPDQSSHSLNDTRFLLSFGPFEELKPGDTLRFTVAFVVGNDLRNHENSLSGRARKALIFHQNGYAVPTPPPSPRLQVSKEQESVTLSWEHVGNNPSANLNGNTFEGYRVYRIDSDTLDISKATLLAQYDVDNAYKYGFQTGIETTFVDAAIRKGNIYWYAVTSYSVVAHTSHWNGSSYDTLVIEGVESSISENAQKVFNSFGPSTQSGEVLVVPNPYRGSEYYVNGDGFEGLEREWTPYKRMVRFIHLPSKATIRIYTIAGEVVATFTHDESAGDTEGQHDFHLFTESGRPLANGIFVFTVESEYGKQIGKFVIAR